MITKRETALSLTADLFAAPQVSPASEPAPAVQSDATPPSAPAAQTPPTAAPSEPAPTTPKKFDASAIQNRYIQDPPPPSAPVGEIPEVPPTVEPGQTPNPKEAFSWAKLRTEAKAFQKEAAEAKARAEAAEAEAKRVSQEQARIAAELEEQRKREQELTEKLGRLSLAESPEFQQKYDLKRAEVRAKLGKALVKFAAVAEADSMSSADRILSADPKDLPTMLGDLNPSVAGMVLALTSEAAALDEARNQELSNWRQTGAAASVENARKTAAEAAASRHKLAVDAIEAAKAYGNPVFAATDPDTQAVAAEISEGFRGFVQTATEAQLVRAAAEGYAAPYLYEVMNQQAAEIAALKDQIASRNRSSMPPVFSAPDRGPIPPPAQATPPNVVPVRGPDSAQDFAMAAAANAVAQFSGLMQPPGR